jgi:hypothetical protein
MQTALVNNGDVSQPIKFNGGMGTLYVQGSSGTFTLTLKWSKDNTTYIPIGSGVTLSADGMTCFGPIPVGYLKASLSGSGIVPWDAERVRCDDKDRM